MTEQTTTRKDGWRQNGGTKFSQWLRNQPEIDSHKERCSATNLDFIWSRFNWWMLIEEKTRSYKVSKWQLNQFRTIHQSISNPYYRGFHIIQFEGSNPDDGKCYIDSLLCTREELIKFLRFELPAKRYTTTFEQIDLLQDYLL